LESAVDELADSPGVDPLDLRLANYAEEDPATGQPWSSKELREAYEEGAAVRLGQAAEQSAARR
jgi:xanthine dehydrogenase YagR molybdenum-binding subunit